MDSKDRVVNNENLSQEHYNKLWLLVEWEMQNGLNSYAIIESTEVIGHRDKDNMHTGKTIYVIRANKMVQATIVIISDDKNFLDTELKQLNRMSAVNLNKMKSLSNGHSVKRRRTTQNYSVSNDDSMTERSKSPAWSNHGDRVISPTPSSLNGHTMGLNRVIPPMTFHQQTQTDSKTTQSSNDFTEIQQQIAKIQVQQEAILDDHKNLKIVSNINNQYLVDLSEQMTNIKTLLKELTNKFLSVDKFEITQVGSTSENNFVVLEASPKNNKMNNKNDLILEDEYSNMSFQNVNNDSRGSLSLSDLQLNKSAPIILNKKNSSSSMSLNQSSTNIVLQDIVKNEWNDSNTSDEELVPIGCNKSMVPKYVMRSINWSSYKAATRKLLITLFPRNVLATHSLTGKPSPGKIKINNIQ